MSKRNKRGGGFRGRRCFKRGDLGRVPGESTSKYDGAGLVTLDVESVLST